MSQVPEISGQATDSNFQAPNSFPRQIFQESPTELEQPPHIPVVEIDGYYPAINGVDPDRRALVIGAEQARYASKGSKDIPEPIEDKSTIQEDNPGGQIELGLSPDGEAESGHIKPLVEMTIYVANQQWFPPAKPVERSVDFRKSARYARSRLQNSRRRR